MKGEIPMAGRKPKPTALKKLGGNPGKRKLNTKEPVPAKGMPECPKWLLPEAKEEWKRLCQKLSDMGVLTEIDMAAFAAYCQKEAQEHIDSEGSTFETDKGYRQQTPWVGIANTNQKLILQATSEFGHTPSARSRIMAAAVALYLLYADNESSAEVGNKHGFSVSGLVFDEIPTQPNRQLYDVLTKGSSDARQNPLHFIITAAGTDRHSISYELYLKAVDILEGRRVDPTFYPVVYGLKDGEDWEDEVN